MLCYNSGGNERYSFLWELMEGIKLSNNQAPTNGGGGGLKDIIIGIIVIAILIILFKFLWQGLTWVFNTYVDLLHVN